jgi:hypothetical protein
LHAPTVHMAVIYTHGDTHKQPSPKIYATTFHATQLCLCT